MFVDASHNMMTSDFATTVVYYIRSPGVQAIKDYAINSVDCAVCAWNV